LKGGSKELIKSIAFDLEGTIIDTEFAHHEGFIRAANDAGIPLTFDEKIFKKIPSLIGGPDEMIAKEIAELQGKRDRSLERFILKRKQLHYEQLLRVIPIKIRPGFLKVLNWLREHKFPTTIGTSTSIAKATILLKKSGLDRFFDRKHIVFAEDVKNLKPAPDVWIKTAEIAGVQPTEQLIFEDSPRGLLSVQAAGAIGIAVPVYNTPLIIEKLKKAGAVKIFTDWRQINISSVLSSLIKELNQDCRRG